MARDNDVPVLEVLPTRFTAAATLLERASQSSNDPVILYTLAMAHKRDGKLPEARAALRKIAKPDANIVLQMALISLREGNLAQAEEELTRAGQMDSQSFAVAYNLALTRLSLMLFEPALKALKAAAELAPSMGEKRKLNVLAELVSYWRPETPGAEQTLIVIEIDSLLENLSPEDEREIIDLVRGLGSMDATFQLMRTLAATRPRSPAVIQANIDCALAKARDLLMRCRWSEVSWLLEPFSRERTSRPNQTALNNLLGCCAYVTGDFEKAVTHFSTAVKLTPNDPRLQQNLALALEHTDELSDAEEHWNRFLELLDRSTLPTPREVPRYTQSLEFETLIHLANRFQEKEKWSKVLDYLNRALRMRPDDDDLMERLFHCYVAAKQPNRARKALDELRRLRPNDPQMDLYELDLVEVKGLTDIERLLTEIEHIMHRYPDDHRVNERAVGMVGNVVPLMGNLCDQLTDQLNKVMNQVGHLPRYQIDWGQLREILRDLMKEFHKLRRITGKCLPLVTSDEHKRIVRDLTDHIDQKIEACRQMGA